MTITGSASCFIVGNLRSIHRKVGRTTIYNTHNNIKTLADSGQPEQAYIQAINILLGDLTKNNQDNLTIEGDTKHIPWILIVRLTKVLADRVYIRSIGDLVAMLSVMNPPQNSLIEMYNDLRLMFEQLEKMDKLLHESIVANADLEESIRKYNVIFNKIMRWLPAIVIIFLFPYVRSCLK